MKFAFFRNGRNVLISTTSELVFANRLKRKPSSFTVPRLEPVFKTKLTEIPYSEHQEIRSRAECGVVIRKLWKVVGTEIRILRAKRSLWNEARWNLAGKSRFSCQLVLSSLDARFHEPHATPRGTSFHFYSPIDPTYAPVKSLFTDLRRWRYKKTKMYRRSRDICKFISSRMLGRG